MLPLSTRPVTNRFNARSRRAGVPSPPLEVAFAHDCRRHDGLFVMLRLALEAVGAGPPSVHVYTCVDPSLRSEYPDLGTIVPGLRVPLGGTVERGVNRLLPVFARKLRDVRADLLHLWSPQLAQVVRYRTDVVVTVPDLAKRTTRYYGRIPSFLYNRQLPYLSRAAALSCYTEWTRRELVRVLRVPEDRVVVVPPPAPKRAGPPRSPPTEPPTPPHPWTLLAVAVDRPHKNLGFFLEVLAQLDARFRAVVVATPRPETRERARQLGLTGRVEFLPPQDDLSPVYRSAHVLVHPSLYEGFGLPVLEAMVEGLPVLVSDATCLPEVVGDGGRVLPPTDARRWAETVEALTDPRRYREASERALARARTFTAERCRSALDRLYEHAQRR